MLEKSEEGSFFVRDSQSRPGCFALTMRVPREANPSGFGNFLIVKVKDGVMIQVQSFFGHQYSNVMCNYLSSIMIIILFRSFMNMSLVYFMTCFNAAHM